MPTPIPHLLLACAFAWGTVGSLSHVYITLARLSFGTAVSAETEEFAAVETHGRQGGLRSAFLAAFVREAQYDVFVLSRQSTELVRPWEL